MSQANDSSKSKHPAPVEGVPSAGKEVDKWEREMRTEADANSGVIGTMLGPYFADEKRLVRLGDAKPSDITPSDVQADTEVLLNGLIEDCRFLIHEVAFHSARLTPDADHRLQFLASAKTLAVTGAEVARTIAMLRQNRAPEPEENRYRMIVEHVATPVQPSGRKGGGRGARKSP